MPTAAAPGRFDSLAVSTRPLLLDQIDTLSETRGASAYRVKEAWEPIAIEYARP
jgi:hypothetical protein